MNYDFDFGVLAHYWPAFLLGVVRTVWITAIVIMVGTPVGTVIGVLMRTRFKPLRLVLFLLVDAVRSLPVIVLIFICYYLFPLIARHPNTSPTVVACVALSLYLAAFQADVVRGGLSVVPRSFVDAGRALGMSRWLIVRRVQLPFVFRTTLPTIAVLWIGMLKNSSLASVIGVYELTHTAGMVASNTFRSIEVYLLIGVVYIVIVMPFSVLARKIEAVALRYNAITS